MTEASRRIAQDSPDPRGFLAAIREHPLLVALVVAFAVGAAAATSVSPERYESEADVLVTPVASDDADFQGLGLLSSTSTSVATAARLVDAPEVTNRVLSKLKSGLTREQMTKKVKVTALPQSDVVSIVVTDPSAQQAAAIANAFAEVLLEQRRNAFQIRLRGTLERLTSQRAQLQGGRGGRDEEVAKAIDRRRATLRSYLGTSDPTLQIFERAVVPDKPKPKSPIMLFVAFFAALLLGTGAALAYPFVSRRIWGEHDLEPDTRILARIPRLNRRQVRRYYSGKDWLPAGAWEPYRTLRARLAAEDPRQQFPRSVLVTSSIKGEGKSMTSSNLAIAIAASGRSVVLLDANLREPRVTDVFGLGVPPRGLASILAGSDTPLESMLIAAGPQWPNLRILAPGTHNAGGVDLVKTDELSSVLERLERITDVIVIDSPAIIEFADAIEIAQCADAVILAVRLGRTRGDYFNETRRILAAAGIPLAGIVLTTRRRRMPRGWSSLSEDVGLPVSPPRTKSSEEAARTPWTRSAS